MSHEMLTREIGRSGIQASAIGLGTWAIGGWMWGGSDERQSIAAIQSSIDEGVTLIDTAPAYGQGQSEEIVGKAIRGRRDKVVLASKCGLVWHTTKGKHFFDYEGRPVHRYLGRESIAYEVEQSLKRLGTDHIDHYITHWQDEITPIEETVAALEDLKRQGKIRSIGASNVSTGDLLIILSILLLFIEVLKATRFGVKAIMDHILSFIVFVAALAEFIMVKQAATSTFLLLLVICFVDVVGGFSISIRTAQRDLALGHVEPGG